MAEMKDARIARNADARLQIVTYADGGARLRLLDPDGQIVPLKLGRIVGVRPRKADMAAARLALAAVDKRAIAGSKD